MYIILFIIILSIFLITYIIRKQKVNNTTLSAEKSSDNKFEQNVLSSLILFIFLLLLLTTNYYEIKDYASNFNKSLNEDKPKELQDIYNYAVSNKSFSLIKELIDKNPENSEILALAAYYQSNVIPEKAIYYASEAIKKGSKYEPWLLHIRGVSKYILDDQTGYEDLEKSALLFNEMLKSNPNDVNILFELANSEHKKYNGNISNNDWRYKILGERFIKPHNYLKQALENSSKEAMYSNMFGWKLGGLHHRIYYVMEQNAKLNIGFPPKNSKGIFKNYTKYNRSLTSGFYDTGFCEIFSKAGEDGYEFAYKVIQKWCN